MREKYMNSITSNKRSTLQRNSTLEKSRVRSSFQDWDLNLIKTRSFWACQLCSKLDQFPFEAKPTFVQHHLDSNFVQTSKLDRSVEEVPHTHTAGAP